MFCLLSLWSFIFFSLLFFLFFFFAFFFFFSSRRRHTRYWRDWSSDVCSSDLVLVPLALAYAWRREGRREAFICFGVLVAVAAAVFAPFVALSPGGVWESFFVQLTRPLQIESLGSALLLAAHQAWGYGVTVETSHGSQNLAGAAPHALAIAQTVLQVSALVAVWVAFTRARPTGEALVRASAAVLVVFVALGKVLSPQFLIWLIPIVPLVRGRRGVLASGLL